MAQPQPSDGFEWTQAPWGAVLRCRPLLAVADHFFTGANIALRDDSEEWLAVAREMGVDLEHLLLLRQVHSAKVVVARRDRSSSGPRPEADVIVSDDPASAIAVRVADCAPVLLGDRRLGVVGAAHAGWRRARHAGDVRIEPRRSRCGDWPVSWRVLWRSRPRSAGGVSRRRSFPRLARPLVHSRHARSVISESAIRQS
jgi:Multi-copper polyphenol oxidoreductase laccase